METSGSVGGLLSSEHSPWIESDALLRDEAVLFGWAGEDEVQARTNAIRSYYDQKAEAARREELRLVSHEEAVVARIADLTAETRVSSERQERDAARLGEARAARWEAVDLLRCSVGVALALAICCFNYAVVYMLLGGGGPAPPTASAGATADPGPPFAATWLIAMGVTLLGMFTLFAPVSVLYRRVLPDSEDRDQAEQGKLWVAELIPALAAAFFTAVWGREPTLLHTVSSFVFVAAVFVFGGKLLLSLLPRLTLAYKQWRAYRELVAEVQASRAAHQELLTRREDQDRTRFGLQEALRALPSSEELQRTCERKINLFVSEVRFARVATEQIKSAGTPKQVVATATV